MDPADRTDEHETSAILDDFRGRGYAVVESLPSLGKGRRCTGLFTTLAEAACRFDAARLEHRRLRFEGLVHHRHLTRRATLRVEVRRVEMEGEETVVEFTAPDVPYDLGGG